MEQIIHITIGGATIAIEAAAYEQYKAYIETLQQRHPQEDGRDEMVTAVETRFSELMQEKIQKGAAFISKADMDTLIDILVSSENPGAAPGKEENQQANTPLNFEAKRRLYRDENNKVIGGVCGGIANWLKMDPTIVRVLFAIITFGGFGSGFLIYLFLWIFLPAKHLETYRGKKMYRNPDDKVIAGIAGGIGAYFKIHPTTLRWIFAIPLILSVLKSVSLFGLSNDFDLFPGLLFGGLTGTLVFVYIVLWIVLPEAITPFQKQEMYGTTTDETLTGEQRSETLNTMKDRLQNWSEEVKQTGQRLGQQTGNFAQTRGRQFSQEFSAAAGRTSRGAGYVIAQLFKAFFMIIAGAVTLALVLLLLVLLFSGFAWAPVNNFLWTSENQQMWAWGSLLFFVGAPIVALLVWFIRRLRNIQTPGNYLSVLFGGLWTVGWVCLILFISSFSKDLSRVESTTQIVAIQQPEHGKLILQSSDSLLKYEGQQTEWPEVNTKITGVSLTPDTLKLSLVQINFTKSSDSLYHVSLIKGALGKTDAEAHERAEKIQYTVQSKDSLLELGNGFAIDKNSKYRFQHMTLVVEVPVGKQVRIDPSIERVLNEGYAVARTYNEARRKGFWIKKSNWQYQSNVDYTMTETGELISAEGTIEPEGSPSDDSYRWNETEDSVAATSPPLAPLPQPDSAADYRYDAAPADSKKMNPATKEQLQRELQKKEQEIEALKKQLGQ